jgi:alanine-glyoxylate transaminase/serine-glyoxylate transaminase/serine-pyruvate transaminase
LGISDPKIFEIMDEIQILLRFVFATKNRVTLALPSTGMSGMEASVVNLVEPNEEFIVLSSGFFGERMAEIGRRVGAKVTEVRGPWGAAIGPEAVESVLSSSNAKVIGLIHGETSTGALQPVEPITKVARDYGALTIVDTVASLGGVEFRTDDWRADVCYTGSQKCLSAPPGLSPITLSEGAIEKIKNRKTTVPTFCLDLVLLNKYWSEERTYHHTPPSLMLYALREALRIVQEEGLEKRWKRHLRASNILTSRLMEELNLRIFARPEYVLSSVATPMLPDGISDLAVRRDLLYKHGIEVGTGIGQLKGKILRIGIMGENANEQAVSTLVDALSRILSSSPIDSKMQMGGASPHAATR